MKITLNDSYLDGFVEKSGLEAMRPSLETADAFIKNRNGKGNDFLGWLDLPENYDRAEFSRIEKAAAKIRENSDVLIVIGIGGSYLGAKAAVDFLRSPHYNEMKKSTPDIFFLGNSFDGRETEEVLSVCEGKRISVNVISKSGTTTESAISFRILRAYLGKLYSKEELKDRVFVTTDKKRGALKKLADSEGYETFVVPDDVGGRYSVLTAVGLLPIAVCGADISALMKGAADERNELIAEGLSNPAYKYALLRNYFYNNGKSVELLASYDPALRMTGEWWKQLYGESEGKDGKGIFPASAAFSTDLHSLGQYIQDGRRILFETVLLEGEPECKAAVPYSDDNEDGLGYIAGKTMTEIGGKAFLGTLYAHKEGGVPTVVVTFGKRDEDSLGRLFYFFWYACAASGYMLGVNPFDQPGVENYKKNMFALLGKPGYEEQRAALAEKYKI